MTATAIESANLFKDFITLNTDGQYSMNFVVEGVHCPACIASIEKNISPLPNVSSARLNLSLRRLKVNWKSAPNPQQVIDTLDAIGFKAHPFDNSGAEQASDEEAKFLLRCFAVAAFASMNIMLLSVSIWAGAFSDITTETRTMFHWVSGLIALPAVAYAGRPFFIKAWRGISHGVMNMDVPIAVGLILAILLSLYETFTNAEHAYFDSAVMLCTFLLAGRYLDQLMRKKTRTVAANLAALKVDEVEKINHDRTTTKVLVKALQIGDQVLIKAGDRIPLDGQIISGETEIDQSLVTGETLPIHAKIGTLVYAGSMNGNGEIILQIVATQEKSFLAEVDRLLEKAMSSKPPTVLLADKVAQYYAPVVHLAALSTIIVWLVLGASLHKAIVIGISVLIITCPCALALAIPAVHVVASGALFKSNLLLNAGDVLERLSQITYVVFDKTGTLTQTEQSLIEASVENQDLLELAAHLASHSHHPISKALQSFQKGKNIALSDITEVPGQGIMATFEKTQCRLGSMEFTHTQDIQNAWKEKYPQATFLGFEFGDQKTIFAIEQKLKTNALQVINYLKSQNYGIDILSGDRAQAVEKIADELGVISWQANAKPADKIAALEALKQQKHKVLMIGDGINDAPALAASYVSLSPITASQITQAASDAVFFSQTLAPIAQIINVSKRSKSIMVQNLSLAVIYNAIFVPLAMLGHATPLIAALAMSGSSILVSVNALRAGKLLKDFKT